MEAACADAIGTALIFLNLLECQTDGFSKFFLAEAKERPALSDASTDMDIDRIGFGSDHLRRYGREPIQRATDRTVLDDRWVLVR